MNSHVRELALKLNQEIKESEAYKDYLFYEQLIKNNEALKKEETALKQLQQKLVNATYHQSDDEDLIRQEYEKRMKAYLQHPLVNNYKMAVEALNELLQYVKDYINGGIK